MTEKLIVPDIGDFENVEVIELLVKEGDQINENDPIVTIESDKSSVEIPSTLTGRIEKIEIEVGDKDRREGCIWLCIWCVFASKTKTHQIHVYPHRHSVYLTPRVSTPVGDDGSAIE